MQDLQYHIKFALKQSAILPVYLFTCRSKKDSRITNAEELTFPPRKVASCRPQERENSVRLSPANIYLLPYTHDGVHFHTRGHSDPVKMEKTDAAATPDLEAPDVPARESSLAQRWKQNLTPTHADFVCLLLTFLTGLCDSSAYNAWSCFLGMQTGTSHTRRSPAKGAQTPNQQKKTKNKKHPETQ